MMKKTILSVVFACVSLVASAVEREVFALTNGWRAAYSDRVEERPSEGSWGVFPRDPRQPFWNGADFSKAKEKPAKGANDYDGMWLERDEEVPSAWQGRRVHVEIPIPMRRCDAVVFVNGARVGEILRPGGMLDVTEQLRFGEANRVALYLTHSGVGTERGETNVNKYDNSLPLGMTAFPRLVVTERAFVTDVFANTSVQRGELVLEVEVDSASAQSATLEAVIRDPEGAVAKSLKEELKLEPGTHLFAPTIAWEKPHYWDFGDGYLYTCEVTLRVGDAVDVYPPFRFGFREVWRDGKELYMNGRPLHMRTCYSYGAKSRGAMSFLQSIGYNVLAVNHDFNGFPLYPPSALNDSDELGLGMILSSGSPLYICNAKLAENEKSQADYEAYQRKALRVWRNHPSLVAAYMSMMTICDVGSVTVDRIGQTVGKKGNHAHINKAREINRKFNPNILYYSHADGPNGDMSSHNLYFNWTPPQEMDEWLSEWATKGVYPWHGAEFDAPYGGCFWYGGGYNGAENMARFVGDLAFETEPLRALEATQELSASNRSGHGSATPVFDFEIDWPYYWEWRRGVVARMNRHWRAYGRNGGVIWFNLSHGYGSHTNALGWSDHQGGSYCDIPDSFDPTVRPTWVSPAYDIYQIANHDFAGFLAGSPDIGDKTHSFYAGETVAKNAALIWDGNQAKHFEVAWTARFEGEKRPFASGKLARTLEPGEIALEAISFKAPKVKHRTSGTLELAFSDGTHDSFAFEVYPKAQPRVSLPRGVNVALFDPAGEDAAILETLGIPFTRLESTTNLGDATHLVIGRRALDQAILGVRAEQLAAGMKVLILPQSPAVWSSLGFQVQDAMAREVFVRDRANPAFAGLSTQELQYWRGSPEYGPLYRPVMGHSAHRGPRGTRRHTVAGLLLKVPEKAGFVPLLDAHFDLNYAALMRFESGKGAITYCTLDLEGRVGTDPAATVVAESVLTDFVGQTIAAERGVVCEGEAAKAMVETLGFAADTATEGMVLVGRDATVSWPDVRAKAETGATVVVVANAALAKAAGFGVEARQFYRAKAGDSALFRAFTPSLLRWHDALEAQVLVATDAVPRAKVYAEGLFAEMALGKGRVVFCQVDPAQLAERFAEKPAEDALAADTEYLNRMVRVLLESLGASKEGESDGLRIHDTWFNGGGNEIAKACGVNRSGKKGVLRVLKATSSGCTRWQTTWGGAREMAERGDTVVVINGTKMAEDAGFTVAPQEVVHGVTAQELGLDGLEDHTFAFGMPLYRFVRAPEGASISSSGWVGSISVGEGRIVFAQFTPTYFKNILEDWDRRKKSADVSVQRMQQMIARILLNEGARPSDALVERVLTRAGASNFQPVGALYVLGPFACDNRTDGYLMSEKAGSAEGEAMALAGDFNPNIEIERRQGGTTNWRPVVTPDAEGCIPFTERLDAEGMHIFYGICPVQREHDGTAILRFGSEYCGRVWCNGELVLNAERGVTCPFYDVRIPLQKGENFLSFKLAAGNEKGRFWVLLERERLDTDLLPETEKPGEKNAANTALYLDLLTGTDPDIFLYW